MKQYKWKKLGQIFNTDLLKDRGLTAALMPIAEVIDYDIGIYRIYFSPRDLQNRSEVHYFEININNPFEILNISKDALYKIGKIGTFDDSGITLGSIVSVNKNKYLFYTGWNLTVNVPMNNSIGIAKLNKFGFFERLYDGPIMTRTLSEPYSCASPFVLYVDEIFKMWYASMDKWVLENNIPKHYYNIKYAESKDGIIWNRTGVVCIDYENNDEYAFGRPHVIKENGIYKMWYSYRGDYYKIGYAESNDGLKWNRKDNEAGISISYNKNDWDFEMITYPYIFDYRNYRYMLYNGNGYGKTGIGLAKLEL